jgi:hypothetical protein
MFALSVVIPRANFLAFKDLMNFIQVLVYRPFIILLLLMDGYLYRLGMIF